MSGFMLSREDGSRRRIDDSSVEEFEEVPCAIGGQDSGAIGEPLGPLVPDCRAMFSPLPSPLNPRILLGKNRDYVLPPAQPTQHQDPIW